MKNLKEGDRVVLSEFGKAIRTTSHNMIGTIKESHLSGKSDFMVLVKWDGAKLGSWMHEHQVKKYKKPPLPLK